MVCEKSDDSAGRGQFNKDHDKRQRDGKHRTVDEKQHHRDHDDRYHGDLRGTLAAHCELIGDERRRAGDIGLDAGRRRRAGHDVADGVDGLVGQRATLITGKKHLNIRGLAVGTLRARRRQRIPPEILDVLYVFGVLGEVVDHGVVKPVGVIGQGLVAFQHDHGHTVGIELVKHLADAFHRLQRRRILGAQRHVLFFCNLLQLRHDSIRDRSQRQPEQRDRHRKPADPLR